MSDRDDWAEYLAGESAGADLDAAERPALDRIVDHLGDDSLWESPSPDGQFRLLAAASAEAAERAKGQTDNNARTAPGPIRPVDAVPAPRRGGRPTPLDGADGRSNQDRGQAIGDDRPHMGDDRRNIFERGRNHDLGPDDHDDDDDDGDVLQLLERRRAGRQRAVWFGAGALITAAAAIVALAATGRLGDLDADGGTGVDETEVAVATDELSATELDPDTVASVDVKPTVAGVEFELTLRGLANTDGDDYYAAWLVGDDGDAVPLGSFHWRAGGVPIVLWSGVDDPAYSRFMVTRQVRGDDGVRSDQVVLMGNVPDLTSGG